MEPREMKRTKIALENLENIPYLALLLFPVPNRHLEPLLWLLQGPHGSRWLGMIFVCRFHSARGPGRLLNPHS